MRRFLIGLAGGLILGYAAVRVYDAVLEVRATSPPAKKDPRAYGRERRRLMLAGMLRSVASLAYMAFALAPNTRMRRLVAVTLALVAGSVLDLPGDYVEDFVLERRYSLSTQDSRAWLADRAKALAVAVAVTVPLIELFVAVVRRVPRLWPLAVTVATAPLLVVANLVAPTFIMPLFNTFEPLTGDIEARLRALARRYNVGDAAILRVDMSRRTEKANAYVTGLFGTHRIVVGDTLLANFTGDEIEFVVAHELGHYVHRDVWRSIGLGTGATAFILVVARALATCGAQGGSETTLEALGRLFFFANVAGIAIGPLLAWTSRSREWAADRFAVAATDAPEWGIAAFGRLRERNLSEDEQPRWMELLFSSHPSLRARIRELEASRR